MTQHYMFAHRILAGLMQSDGTAFQKALIEQGQDLLQRLWIHAGCHVGPGTGAGPTFSHHQLTSSLEALVVQLPPPQQPPEAYFVAMVRAPGQAPKVYTLEMGTDHPFLCGWQGDTHANMGAGPEPTREAFLEALRKL